MAGVFLLVEGGVPVYYKSYSY